LIVGNGILLFTIALHAVVTALVPEPRPTWYPLYGPSVDILALVTFFAVISKAWKQIQQLPPAE
jgi:hypothetical protein